MERLIALLKKYNYICLFLALESIAIFMITRNSYYQSSRIISCGNHIAGQIYTTTNSIQQYFGLRHENDILAKENAQLRARLAESYVQYDYRTFANSDTLYQQRYAYTDAQVIKSSWDQIRNVIIVNKGSRQGIKPDMAVISPQGIVGVILSTPENFSTILPILHPDSRNSVTIARDNTKGSLIWEGKDYRYASVIDIPTTHRPVKNDTIITSGLSNDFPKGVTVGYVQSAAAPSGSGFYKITIRLATDFSKLDHVYIITNQFTDGLDSLYKTLEPRELL